LASSLGHKNVDVQRPKPQTTHTRLSRHNQFISLLAKPFGFLDLAATEAHFVETAKRFEMRVEETRRRMGELFGRGLQRFISTAQRRLNNREVGSHESQHTVLADRFGKCDARQKLLLGLLGLAQEETTKPG